MKRLISLFILSFFFLALSAQDKGQSNVEKFSSKVGTLIKKEYVSIGEVKKCEISVIDIIRN
jgi:hypothetical protein